MNSAVAHSAAHARIGAIDDEFLEGVAAGAPGFVTDVHVKREAPYFTLEVVSDPHVDDWAAVNDGLPNAAQRDDLVQQFVSRYQSLRRPFGEDAPELVVTRGALTIEQTPGSEPNLAVKDPYSEVWAPAFARMGEKSLGVLSIHPDGAHGELDEIAAIFRIFLADPHRPAADAEPFAYVAVVGWPNDIMRSGERRASRTLQLIQRMTDQIAVNTPLHVICATDVESDHPALSRECERLRVPIVITGGRGDAEIVTSKRSVLAKSHSAGDVTVARCPSFKSGVGKPGVARLRINVWRGEAEIASAYDLGSDRFANPVQVVTPLSSASRVSTSERRLYANFERLIDRQKTLDTAQQKDPTELTKFENEARDRWIHTGYATLSSDSGSVPLTQTRQLRYNLLLLLREREDAGYDVLLNNHSPMRASQLSDWNTLLFPAFQNVRGLLEHLRDDVRRQVVERAEDFERAAHAQEFEEAVERILADESGRGQELWADEVREIASRKIRKISPTTGAVTEFDYRLVTLLPFIDRSIAKAPDDTATSPEDDATRRDRHRIIDWLNGLDTVRPSEGERASLPGLAVEALQPGGSGLRWDPAAALIDQPDQKQRHRNQRAWPGAIWFPLDAAGDQLLWHTCESMISRNADVIGWIEEVLKGKGLEDGDLPPELLLGRYDGGQELFELVSEVFPFDDAGTDTPTDPDVPGRSTVDALRKVTFSDDFDLRNELAYEGAEFKRVYLVRKPHGEGDDLRSAIHVVDAGDGEPFTEKLRSGGTLGILRPVQRYVLETGLVRAQLVNEQVLELLAKKGDAWGFVRVRKGAAPQNVTVTPPIIEQMHQLDRDDLNLDGLEASTAGDGPVDFIVCDGNHRIIQRLFGERDPQPMAAVAVVGALNHPYYARPFGRLEWDATADNVQIVTPEPASKYLARHVSHSQLAPDAQHEYADINKDRLYRRYFRDLTTGFGYLGGQGGRYV